MLYSSAVYIIILSFIVEEVLIESEGSAAERQGSRLGYYYILTDTHDNLPAFKQRGGPNYMYSHSGAWKVSTVLGKSICGLSVSSSEDYPPSTGW